MAEKVEATFLLSENTLFVLQQLNAAGFEAFLVGGCVRDFFMQITAQDIDISTNALPEQVCEVFHDFAVIKTGLKHGTVTVMIAHQPFEITSYRTESTYSDFRRPDCVIFTKSLQEDSCRRDFTMNALAYHPKTGLIDYHSGLQDLNNKTIRCVGNPNLRFQEDPLRILRAIRFASTLGFEIEPNTKQAMFAQKHLLAHISSERIFSELKKFICGKYAHAVLIDYFKIIAQILPCLSSMENFEQNNPHHIYTVSTHTAVMLKHLPAQPILRLAALFHDCGKPACYTVDQNGIGHFYHHGQKSFELACEALRTLKADKATTRQVSQLVLLHDMPLVCNPKFIKKLLNKHGQSFVMQLLCLKRADNLAQNYQQFNRTKEYDKFELLLKQIIEQEECFSLKNLAVSGNDLLLLNICQGKQIGFILNQLLEQVLQGKLENKKEVLITYVKQKFL